MQEGIKLYRWKYTYSATKRMEWKSKACKNLFHASLQPHFVAWDYELSEQVYIWESWNRMLKCIIIWSARLTQERTENDALIFGLQIISSYEKVHKQRCDHPKWRHKGIVRLKKKCHLFVYKKIGLRKKKKAPSSPKRLRFLSIHQTCKTSQLASHFYTCTRTAAYELCSRCK